MIRPVHQEGSGSGPVIRYAKAAALVALCLLLVATVAPACGQTYTALHNFTNTPDGWEPWGGLAMDRSGNLYGTTQYGGTYRAGYVFKMTRKNGSWVISPLYSFRSDDGSEPMARVTIGPDGSLYGTTSAGGTCCGTVFNLKPPIGPCKSFLCPWTETVLYRFAGGSDGSGPEAPVIFDQAGNLYGTTVGGGSARDGVVFELTRSGSSWTESVLYSFTGTPDGSEPMSGLTLDSGETCTARRWMTVSSEAGWFSNSRPQARAGPRLFSIRLTFPTMGPRPTAD